MTRAFSTTILVTAMLTLASAPLGAQTPADGQLRAAPTFAGRSGAPAPDRISLINVENRLTEVGGLYIHMNAVEIDSVLSPRLFTIRRPLTPRYEEDEPIRRCCSCWTRRCADADRRHAGPGDRLGDDAAERGAGHGTRLGHRRWTTSSTRTRTGRSIIANIVRIAGRAWSSPCVPDAGGLR